LITSSSEVTCVVEKVKTLTAKEKASEFKLLRERDQLSTVHENEEHHGRTRAISSIASWKEWFADESHLYKNCKTQEIVHNTKETFAQQFFNFMRKNPQYVVHMPITEIAHNTKETFAQQFFNFMRKKPTICCANAYYINQFGSQCHCPITLCSEQCWLCS
jgi:hypothetical protein